MTAGAIAPRILEEADPAERTATVPDRIFNPDIRERCDQLLRRADRDERIARWCSIAVRAAAFAAVVAAASVLHVPIPLALGLIAGGVFAAALSVVNALAMIVASVVILHGQSPFALGVLAAVAAMILAAIAESIFIALAATVFFLCISIQSPFASGVIIAAFAAAAVSADRAQRAVDLREKIPHLCGLGHLLGGCAVPDGASDADLDRIAAAKHAPAWLVARAEIAEMDARITLDRYGRRRPDLFR